MIWLENVRAAFRAVTANKLQSALTVLGILIGVGAVIIVVAVGNGSSQAVQNRIKELGTNTLTITNRGRFGRGPSTGGTQSRAATITLADVNNVDDPNQAPDVASASPVVTANETADLGSASTSVSVTGTTPTFMSAEDYQLQAGRQLSSADITNHSMVVVIGQDLVSNLYNAGQNPIGSEISFGAADFQVIGVLANKGASGGQDLNDIAIVPYTTAEDQLTGYVTSFSGLIVQAKSSGAVNAAQNEVESILASANQTTVANLPFNVINESSLLTTSNQTNQTFTVLLAVIAAVSLVVGGIGIMNIMLVTVTERTREIGIRKAIGSPRSAILSQFLTEAVMLSLIGGFAGVIVGVVGSRFKIVGVQPVVEPTSIVEAFAVAVVVGVFFGFYPANRAASLRPIEALRHE